MTLHLDELQDNAIETLRSNTQLRLRERAAAILHNNDTGQEWQERLERILHERERLRKPGLSPRIWQRHLARHGEKLLEKMEQRYAQRRHGFSWHMVESFNHAAVQRRESANVKKLFNGRERIYLRLRDSRPVTPDHDIEQYLQKHGYKVLDYAGGYAVDLSGKQRYRIGRLLGGAPDLLAAFKKRRTHNTQSLMIVLSKNAMDIARASENRGWTSCIDPRVTNGRAESSLAPEIRNGSLVAYLVRESDPDIHDPLSRILLKPYHRRENKIVQGFLRLFNSASASIDRNDMLYVAGNVYGLPHVTFFDAVEKIVAEKLNTGLSGRFEMPDDLYPDRMPTVLWRKKPAGF